jgi:hypothetical protein
LEFGVSQVSTGEKVGLVAAIFYNAHFVVGDIPRLSGYVSRGFLTGPVYLAIPVLLLLLIAGAFVYSEADASGRLDAILSGASLVIGYFVLFFVVMFVFRSIAGPGYLPIGMTIVSGLLYPIVLGGVAGLVAYELERVIGDGSTREESRVGET